MDEISSKLKSKKRETVCTDTKDEINRLGGMARLEPVTVVPRYMIPNFDPYQKQVNHMERLMHRRNWKGGVKRG